MILTRRSVIRSSAALLATSALVRPHIANAAAKTATVWWTQGFVPEEDAAFRKVVDAYQKQSGNTIDFSLIPFAPLMQKIVSALTSGDVPDLISHDINDAVVVPQNAWDDKVVDASDIVEAQRADLHPTIYLGTQYYNNTTKKRGGYLIPFKTAAVPIHVWGSLVEKAGYHVSDAPKTWDAFWDFFKPMQAKLRETTRNIYAIGLQCTTVGPADGNNMFNQFLIANGGNGIVTGDGKPHLDDPQVKEAAIKALTYITTAFKGGYVPSGALSWNDADDNNAFHSKLMIADFDGTISTEVAIKDKAERDQVVTMGLTQGNDGKPMPAQLGIGGAFIPKGAKNIDVAKDFMKYLVQPTVVNDYLRNGLGRWLPPYPSLVHNDLWWFDDPHRKPYTTEALIDPTVPGYPVFNPGWAVVNAQQVWGSAEADVIRNGATPQAAVETAFKKIQTILDKYPVVQS